MADAQDLQDQVQQLMKAIEARLDESPPPLETDTLKVARGSLEDALDELPLSRVSAAAQDVANAANDLQQIVSSAPSQFFPGGLQSALDALGTLVSSPGAPNSSGTGLLLPQGPMPGASSPGVAAPSAPAPGAASSGLTVAAQPPTAFASNVEQTATDQWTFFGQQEYDADGHVRHVGHKEGEDPWFKRVGQYWLEGTNTHGLDGQDHSAPWSAAFISWVMKKAGAGNRFRYSTQHSVYIAQSIRDFSSKRDAAGFWGQRLNEYRPAVGDLVCWSRQDGVDYDHQLGGDYKGHSDIVVAVESSRIWIIGGNVGDSVTKRPLPLDLRGFLLPTTQGSETIFAIMQDRISTPQMDSLTEGGGAAGAGASPATPPAGGDGASLIAWGRKVSAPFKAALLNIVAGLECDPSHLMACMAFETGESFSPSIQNPTTKATGLIQFMPETARSLGTSIDQLAAMNAVAQLRFVQKYLSPFSGKMRTLSDVYMTILFPRAVGKPESFVLFASPSVAYNENRGLDVNNDGSITKGEAAGKVQQELEKGLSVNLVG